nr:synaptobrevin, longin-like domain protein [Tanacetum cinerariifolium]
MLRKCLSPKSTSFNEFSSNIAIALVCLATNRTYNFSKMIFDGMMRNVKSKELFASTLVPQGEGSEHLYEPHHIPSDQDESIHHEQITQSSQHAQITSPKPIPQSYEQTTSQEPTIPSQSHSVITTHRRITRGSIQISQSKVPSPGADETTFPTGDVRYREAFSTDTSLDVGQDRENIAKTSAIPHESLPRVTSLGGGKGRGCFKHEGVDQGEDLLDRDKSVDKGSDSTNEMSHVLGSLGAANILASVGLRSFFMTTSIVISPAVATANGSFPTAAILPLPVEHAARDFEIARIHAERELELMIVELDRSNETIVKYLSEYEQAEVGLSHDEKFLHHSSANFWQWDLHSSGSGNTLHWQWELILPVGTLSPGSGNALCILFPTILP